MKYVEPFLRAYANWLLQYPKKIVWGFVLATLVAGVAASQLRINSNQLDLISQDLPEVKDVKRIIDMVGGSGYLMLALRSAEPARNKLVADDLAAMLQADTEHVRFVTYRMPVQFAQENMVLFVDTADLQDAKKRINTYLRQKARRANPFFLQLQQTPEPTLNLTDLTEKYSHLGKKTILDDYYISVDTHMLLLLIKPMWDTNELAKTHAFLQTLRSRLQHYNAHDTSLVEDYDLVGVDGTIAYGFTGSYKTSLDDSYAMSESLAPVSLWAFVGIVGVTVLFFRKWLPCVVVLLGVLIGTVLTMGFAYVTIGTLNMITSILGGILMGFGVDYGIHFMFRTRIELALGKSYEQAIADALLHAGRPALVAAVVTAGSFMVLLVSQFRGFSQFGLLAGCGTLIIAFTMFSWSAAVLLLLGRRWSQSIPAWLGTMPMAATVVEPATRGRHAKPWRWLLGLCALLVLAVCAFALPWAPSDLPIDASLSLWQKLQQGVRFNYNTRALMPAGQPSVKLQDEINRRFKISSDPVAIYTKDLAEAKELYDELTLHSHKYNTFDQVVSIYSFVPNPITAKANAAILAQWQQELDQMGFNAGLLPQAMQDKMPLIQRILHAKPYTVAEVPAVYARQFKNLPTAHRENQGILTFVYPKVDLWDGAQMLRFADQVALITTETNHVYHGAGLPILYAKLAGIVLFDGKLTVLLTSLWILFMHFLDFKSVRLALASVIPLCVGLLMMLGLMSITAHPLNFMNIIMLPILLGFGVSHGLYLLHRFLEGTSMLVAMRSVGAAVASSTLTAMAGFAALQVASHNGLKSMGYVACLGLATTLLVSFTVLATVLQLLEDKR